MDHPQDKTIQPAEIITIEEEEIFEVPIEESDQKMSEAEIPYTIAVGNEVQFDEIMLEIENPPTIISTTNEPVAAANEVQQSEATAEENKVQQSEATAEENKVQQSEATAEENKVQQSEATAQENKDNTEGQLIAAMPLSMRPPEENALVPVSQGQTETISVTEYPPGWLCEARRRKNGVVDRFYFHKGTSVRCRSLREVSRYEQYGIRPGRKGKEKEQIILANQIQKSDDSEACIDAAEKEPVLTEETADEVAAEEQTVLVKETDLHNVPIQYDDQNVELPSNSGSNVQHEAHQNLPLQNVEPIPKQHSKKVKVASTSESNVQKKAGKKVLIKTTDLTPKEHSKKAKVASTSESNVQKKDGKNLLLETTDDLTPKEHSKKNVESNKSSVEKLYTNKIKIYRKSEEDKTEQEIAAEKAVAEAWSNLMHLPHNNHDHSPKGPDGGDAPSSSVV